MVVLPEMPVETSCEQEQCVEMKTCNVSLAKMFKSKESVHNRWNRVRNAQNKWSGSKGITQNHTIRKTHRTRQVKTTP